VSTFVTFPCLSVYNMYTVYTRVYVFFYDLKKNKPKSDGGVCMSCGA